MKITYQDLPVEGRKFSFVVSGVKGQGRFRALLGGDTIWEDECDDPPCHEQFRLPAGVAGETLLIEAEDAMGTEELMFFINDDGEGVAVERMEAEAF